MTEQGLHDQAAMMIDAASEFVSSAARLCADKVESLHLLTAPVISEFFSTTRSFYEKMSLEDFSFTTTTYFAPFGVFVRDYRQELVTGALVLLAILFDLCLVAFLSKTKSSRHSSTPKSSAASRTITPLLLAEDLPAKEEARETETVAHWIQAVGDIDKDDIMHKEKICNPEKITTDKIELPREEEQDQDVDHAAATAHGGLDFSGPEMKPNPKADDSSDGILEVDGSGTSHGNVISLPEAVEEDGQHGTKVLLLMQKYYDQGREQVVSKETTSKTTSTGTAAGDPASLVSSDTDHGQQASTKSAPRETPAKPPTRGLKRRTSVRCCILGQQGASREK